MEAFYNHGSVLPLHLFSATVRSFPKIGIMNFFLAGMSFLKCLSHRVELIVL